MELNNIIFSFVLLFFGYCISKYSLSVLNRLNLNFLADDQFRKPQAFHENSTHRLGGIIIFSQLILVFLYLYIFQNIFFFEFTSICTLFFLLGFADDLKINIPPKFRLFTILGCLLKLFHL